MRNVKEKEYGGEGGIRTHGTVSRTLAFEASTFNRSVTSPQPFAIVTDGLRSRQRAIASCTTRYSGRFPAPVPKISEAGATHFSPKGAGLGSGKSAE